MPRIAKTDQRQAEREKRGRLDPTNPLTKIEVNDRDSRSGSPGVLIRLMPWRDAQRRLDVVDFFIDAFHRQPRGAEKARPARLAHRFHQNG